MLINFQEWFVYLDVQICYFLKFKTENFGKVVDKWKFGRDYFLI